MTNKGWCEYCYLKDEKPCYECNACFKGSNFRAIKTIKPTNYERIKNMSVEEMATFLLDVTDCCVAKDCANCVLGKDNIAYCNTELTMTKWLKSEVTDNA